MLITAS